MNKIEEAIIYATVMHAGKVRKFGNRPFILHSLEVAHIISTMTDDEDVITAGILHDIVEETDGTLGEVEKRFGSRVAILVSSETEDKFQGEDPNVTWKRRKESSLKVLKNSQDIGVKMLWLADKLANIRSLAGLFSEKGEAFWQELHQKDPEVHRWYYQSIAETLEFSLNRTAAFKEYIKHLTFIWPRSFDSEKAKYKKYKEVSVDGCALIGRGAKGDVYRYDDELIIKVFNQNNTFRDVEKEIALSRKAFILGIPTAISFGIVSVGERYGAMYEMVDAETVSSYIAKSPGQVKRYALVMAELARTIHSIEVSGDESFPDAIERLRGYIRKGIAYEDEALANRCMKLLDALPATGTLVHGDFHTGNVFMDKGEPLLIDMDRISMGNPYVEISDMYYFYVILGEEDPSVVESFMGFSYETACAFFREFLKLYLGTESEDRLNEVIEKASFIGYLRAIHRIHKKPALSEREKETVGRYLAKIESLAQRLDSLDIL
ncbi:MAG: HD domain-containing protein [Lachnospiraceae bacterium]|nr:HD domain-containing protein [Lachnospiraceae bacterium]